MPSTSPKSFSNVYKEKSKRSSNFSTKEVKYLIQLVGKKKQIINSKKSDRATSEEKIKAWKEIEVEFNSVFEDYRSFRVLKTKFDNLKKNVKRKLPNNLSNLSVLKIMEASENQITNEPLSDFDYNVSEDENTLQNSTASDSDMKPLPSLNEEELKDAAEEYVFETLLFGDTKRTTPPGQEENISNPQTDQLKPLVEKKNVTATVDIWEQVAYKKLKKLELEINVIEEEWKLRKQKLKLEVQNIGVENKLKEEKLKLELELLKQKLGNINST